MITVEDVENTLIREGHIPRVVKLSDDSEAHFWVQSKELWIFGPRWETELPFFDPTKFTDAQLIAKLRKYLTFS